MNVHILITTLVLIVFMWSVFGFRGALKLLILDDEEKIEEGGKLLLFCYKCWFFSAMIMLPFSFSKLLPISYYLFESSGLPKGVEWYLVLHIVLLGVSFYGMYGVDSIASSLEIKGRHLSNSIIREIKLGKTYLEGLGGFLVLWLVVGMQYSLFESDQPSPQALVTYSPFRFFHWISVVGYVSTSLMVFIYLPKTRWKFRWWLIPTTLLFLASIWLSMESVTNSLVSGCYTLWCK